MSIEQALVEALSPLVEGRVSPLVVDDFEQTYPWITFQQIGGRAGWYLERAVPSRLNARVQLNTWAKSMTEAADLARRIEQRICVAFDAAEPLGAFTATYEERVNLYGTRQDFSIWYEP